MKFSFLTYQFCRFPLEFSFQVAQRYGFDGVEVWGGRPHAYAYDMDAEAVARILAWKEKYGVQISMFTPEILAYPYSFASASKKEREETLQYLIRSVECAAAMGTDKMQITVPHSGYSVERAVVWANIVEGISGLCKTAEKEGVDIIIESLSPSEGNMITTVHDIKQLMQEVNSPRLKSMIDVVPPLIANEPYSDYFTQLGEKMAYIHICNSDGGTEFHMQLDDAAGVIPIADMFAIFKAYGYEGWCSLELLAPYFRDPELYLVQSARMIKKVCTMEEIKCNMR